ASHLRSLETLEAGRGAKIDPDVRRDDRFGRESPAARRCRLEHGDELQEVVAWLQRGTLGIGWPRDGHGELAHDLDRIARTDEARRAFRARCGQWDASRMYAGRIRPHG